MSLRAYFYCLLIPIFLFNSCFFKNECERGEGESEVREIELPPIQTITFGIAGSLIIESGAEQKILVEGQANMQDILRNRVENGSWNIMFTKCVDLHEPFTITVTLPSLQGLVLSGAGLIRMEDRMEAEGFSAILTGSGTVSISVDAERLDAKIFGSGLIEAEGSADLLQVTLAGSGTIDTYDLIATNANVDIPGSGEVFIEVVNELNIIISGSGNVTYRGEPKIVSNIVGSGKVFNGN